MYNEKFHDEYSTWNIIRTVKRGGGGNEGGFSSHDVIKKNSEVLKRINNLEGS